MVDLRAVNNEYSFLGLRMPISFEHVVFLVHFGTFWPKNELTISILDRLILEGAWFYWAGFRGVEVYLRGVYFPCDLMLVSVVRFFIFFINVNAFVIFIEIHCNNTSFKIKTLFGRWLRTRLLICLILFLRKPLFKSGLFSMIVWLLLEVIYHIFKSKLGCRKTHALHPGFSVILILVILEIHEWCEIRAAWLSWVVRVTHFELILVLLESYEHVWLTQVLGECFIVDFVHTILNFFFKVFFRCFLHGFLKINSLRFCQGK